MSTSVTRARPTEPEAERRAALQRLDADLRAVARAARDATPVAHQTLELLRRRSVAVYRLALQRGAGLPDDGVWTLLSLTVAAFVAYASDLDAHDPMTHAAARRLQRLAAD